MNTVDTLMSNVCIVLMAIGTVYMAGLLAVAFVHRHSNLDNIAGWKSLAVLSVMLGVVSGRIQLICFAAMILMACLFNHYGLPKMAMVTVASGVLNMVYCTVVYMLNVSMSRSTKLA